MKVAYANARDASSNDGSPEKKRKKVSDTDEEKPPKKGKTKSIKEYFKK